MPAVTEPPARWQQRRARGEVGVGACMCGCARALARARMRVGGCCRCVRAWVVAAWRGGRMAARCVPGELMNSLMSLLGSCESSSSSWLMMASAPKSSTSASSAERRCVGEGKRACMRAPPPPRPAPRHALLTSPHEDGALPQQQAERVALQVAGGQGRRAWVVAWGLGLVQQQATWAGCTTIAPHTALPASPGSWARSWAGCRARRGSPQPTACPSPSPLMQAAPGPAPSAHPSRCCPARRLTHGRARLAAARQPAAQGGRRRGRAHCHRSGPAAAPGRCCSRW